MSVIYILVFSFFSENVFILSIHFLGSHIETVFQLDYPHIDWSWADLLLNVDNSFELIIQRNKEVYDMLMSNHDNSRRGSTIAPPISSRSNSTIRKSFMHSFHPSSNPSPSSSKRSSLVPNALAEKFINANFSHIGLKGGLHICNPDSDHSLSNFYAFFLVSPKIHNLNEMIIHNLTLPDFPR